MCWSQLSPSSTSLALTSRVSCTELTTVQPTCRALWGSTTSKPTTMPMWCYRYEELHHLVTNLFKWYIYSSTIKCFLDCVLGFFQCSTIAKLFLGGGKLQGNPQTTRGHHVPLGAEVRWADAQTLESEKLQGPCVSPWDAAGCGALQQEELSDYQAR